MCVGVEKTRLMARIGPEAYDGALTRKGCRPMDFTERPTGGDRVKEAILRVVNEYDTVRELFVPHTSLDLACKVQ